ncbi:MAG: flagellar export chaperone FliS [Burkholderiaceae bacterium]
MFSQNRNPSHALSGMYQKMQVDTGVESASKHRLVGMLFEGLLDACAQARGHLQSGNVEAKCKALQRATRIVDEGLKARLDLAGGGKLAMDLRDLYAYVSVRLTHANLHNDEAAIDECQRLVRPIQSAWESIGLQAQAA